jgi:aldehyde dehydrogenase (NAD+)
MGKYAEILQRQRAFFDSGKTRDPFFRKKQLQLLKRAIKLNEQAINKALRLDLNKAPLEAYTTEVGFLLQELGYMINNVLRLAAPKRVLAPLIHFPSTTVIYKEPYGSVLIISPWNYPLQLSFAPLIGAIAAGNCAVIKTSQYAPNCSKIIAKIVKETFDPDYVTVIEGEAGASEALLEEKFDYIFFTGSVEVGKSVMAAAAKNLTPVTLELGGKSPCIVTDTASLKLAAKRIVWGKFLNAGQTCIAPDYILVSEKVKDAFVNELKKFIAKQFTADPLTFSDYPKIINEKHFNRLLKLIEGESVIHGGGFNKDKLSIEPTLLDEPAEDSPVMSGEIFGPILPIISYTTLESAAAYIKKRPKPLALYCFSESRTEQKYFIDNVSFGGGTINDTVIHISTSNAGFGGVGDSGMGQYHGKASFDTFSHSKTIMQKGNWLDFPYRYHPCKKHNLDVVKFFMH